MIRIGDLLKDNSFFVTGEIDLISTAGFERTATQTNGFCAGRDDNRAFRITGQESFNLDLQRDVFKS